MLNPNPPDPRPDFLQELQVVWEDPQVKKLARRRAEDPDLAEDALQAAFYAVARVANPAAIRDLSAYFRQVLIHEIYRLSGQLRAIPVEDPTSLADARQDGTDGSKAAPRSVFETVCTNLLAEKWLKFLASQRAKLTIEVPGRSPDPDRYRATIAAIAERVLRMIMIGNVSDADGNEALLIAYPEWFNEPKCSENTRHQRFKRAREDVRSMLQMAMSRDDLLPLTRARTRSGCVVRTFCPNRPHQPIGPSHSAKAVGWQPSAEVGRAIATAYRCRRHLLVLMSQGGKRLGRVKWSRVHGLSKR